MRRSRSVHTVRLVLGLVAVSLSLLGAVRGANEVPTATAQSATPVASNG
jgi:hypothetical protein